MKNVVLSVICRTSVWMAGLVVSCIILLTGCSGNGRIPDPLPLPTRVPDDIPGYFKELEERGVARPVVHNPEEGEEEQIREILGILQEYAKGERKYYPVEEVNDGIYLLSLFVKYQSGHSTEFGDAHIQVENYLNHFTAIAAFLCPKLDYLAWCKDAGSTLGVQQYYDWGHTCVLRSYVLHPTDQGLSLQVVPELNAVNVSKIFTLKDNQGRSYYLFMDDESSCPVLFMSVDGRLEFVAGHDDLYHLHRDYDNTIVFNPDRLVRNFCTERDGVFHPIPETPQLKLHLDGKQSRFQVE